MNHTDELLLEWGRWARSELPTRIGPDGVPLAPFPAYEQWRPVNEREPGWGDYDAIPEPMLEPWDEQRCKETDDILREMTRTDGKGKPIHYMGIKRFLTIKRHYFNQWTVPWEDLQSARRAFADLVTGMVRRAA